MILYSIVLYNCCCVMLACWTAAWRVLLLSSTKLHHPWLFKDKIRAVCACFFCSIVSWYTHASPFEYIHPRTRTHKHMQHMHIYMYCVYKETVTARWYTRKHYKKETRGKTISGYTSKSVIVCCVITVSVYCVYTVPHVQYAFLHGAPGI